MEKKWVHSYEIFMLRNKNVDQCLNQIWYYPHVYSKQSGVFAYLLGLGTEGGTDNGSQWFLCRCCQHRLQGFLLLIYLERDMEIWNVQEGTARSPGMFHTAKQQRKIFLRGLFLVEIHEPTKCTCASAIWHCILRQIYIKKDKEKENKTLPVECGDQSFCIKSLLSSQKKHSGLSLIIHWVWRHHRNIIVWFQLS